MIIFAQAEKGVFGSVVDANTNEPLPGAHLHILDTKEIYFTNNEGIFQLPKNTGGQMRLIVSHVGYSPDTSTIDLSIDSFRVISLKDLMLDEVVVYDRNQIRNSSLEITTLPMQKLERLPMIMGERDVLKALSFFPGVNSGVEGKSDLYVRGGTSDQNLILFDDVPIYSSGHLFGFISIFNSLAIKNVDLYKGEIPARFGGRLSSVIDVVSKEGASDTINGEYSFGLINSQMNVNGAISKKTSFSLAGRLANLGILLAPLKIGYDSGSSDNYFNFWMYDVNAKFTWRINKRQKIIISVLSGSDAAIYLDGTTQDNETSLNQQWNNRVLSLKHSLAITPNWFFKTSFFISRFVNDRELENSIFEPGEISKSNYTDFSRLSEYGVRFDNQFLVNRLSFNTGFYFSGFKNLTNQVEIRDRDNFFVSSPGLNKELTQLAIYLSSQFRINNNLSSTIGLRFCSFFGPNEYEDAVFEPRVNLAFRVSQSSRFMLSATRMSQPLHLLNGQISGLPASSWITASRNQPVETSKNLSFSYQLDRRHWSWEVGAYYRTMRDLTDFPLGTQFFFDVDQDLENKISGSGKGKALGLEVLLRKNTGNTQGWFSLTISDSQRRFEAINDGSWYPTQYRRILDAKIFIEQKLKQNRFLSANVVYGTGQPLTLPDGFSDPHPIFQGVGRIPLITTKHGFTSDYYLRVDLQYLNRYTTKRGREGNFILGIYNVSGRANPWTTEITEDYIEKGDDFFVRGVQKSLSPFNFIPYFSIGRKF